MTSHVAGVPFALADTPTTESPTVPTRVWVRMTMRSVTRVTALALDRRVIATGDGPRHTVNPRVIIVRARVTGTTRLRPHLSEAIASRVLRHHPPEPS